MGMDQAGSFHRLMAPGVQIADGYIDQFLIPLLQAALHRFQAVVVQA